MTRLALGSEGLSISDLAEESSSDGVVPGLSGDALSGARQQIRELTAALAARDRLLSMVGHELRNSVSPLLLLAEQFAALAEQPQAQANVAARAGSLTRQLTRFITTVDRLVDLADLRRGKLHLEPTPVDLAEVVEEVCREAVREAAAGGAELVVHSTGQVTGTWDRARVKQIASHLVSNAIRYGGGDRIELELRGGDRDVALAIRDHGPGIAAGELEHLFDRLDHDRPRRAGGFGVGLWVVKTLCAAMQGSVTAENCSSGGARFCVVLPRG
ncbi:MAG TPA: HAMP domain-containing sensor histidine kinase [Kofleriaceae bacterium]|nr:HAMP domain-containing sensor histidine kinase [Kofleriaceae bacterium]